MKSNSKKKVNKVKIDLLDQIADISNQALTETEEAISTRQKLTRQFLYEIEKEIREAMRMLKFLGDHWKHGDKTEYEFMRISLDKALTARKKERRERLLQEWKDLLDLRVKRLELFKENVAMNSIDVSPKNASKRNK